MDAKVIIPIGLTVFLWASAFLGNKLGLTYFTPGELALLRYAIASFVLLLISIYKKIRFPEIKDLIMIFACGFLGISIYNLLLYYGQLTVMPGTASLLVNTAPIFTTLLSVILLKEKVSEWGWLSLFISFTGVILIVLGQKNGIQLDTGALLILGAAITFSLYFIIQKPLLLKYNGLEVTTYSIWAGTILLLPYTFTMAPKLPSAPNEILYTVTFLGIFPGAIAYYCWSVVNQHLPASVAAPFLYLTPVFSMIFSYFIFKEVPSIITITGGIIAITGVYATNLFKRSGIG